MINVYYNYYTWYYIYAIQVTMFYHCENNHQCGKLRKQYAKLTWMYNIAQDKRQRINYKVTGQEWFIANEDITAHQFKRQEQKSQSNLNLLLKIFVLRRGSFMKELGSGIWIDFAMNSNQDMLDREMSMWGSAYTNNTHTHTPTHTSKRQASSYPGSLPVEVLPSD